VLGGAQHALGPPARVRLRRHLLNEIKTQRYAKVSLLRRREAGTSGARAVREPGRQRSYHRTEDGRRARDIAERYAGACNGRTGVPHRFVRPRRTNSAFLARWQLWHGNGRTSVTVRIERFTYGSGSARR
jgi:hypothetical protein